jgi:hypothetical protein
MQNNIGANSAEALSPMATDVEKEVLFRVRDKPQAIEIAP